MRKFFSSKSLIVVLLLIAYCLGCAVYTGASGRSTPVSQLAGMIVAPIQKLVTTIGNKINDSYDYAFQYDQMKQENAALKVRISELEQRERDAAVAIEENDRLRALLGIKERNRDFQLEIAEIIARSAGSEAMTVTIDKGIDAGIEVGDCVITEEGMVGYVASVAPTYAEVTTVIDTDMQAGALITRTREIAVAEGDYEMMKDGLLRLSYLKKDADVVIGDTIETSGRGGIFPKGIMIGTIERIIPEDHGISNYAVVKPFVDIADVRSVSVITSFEVTE